MKLYLDADGCPVVRQALAIAAAGREGAELSIGYADGGASVSAQWLAE